MISYLPLIPRLPRALRLTQKLWARIGKRTYPGDKKRGPFRDMDGNAKFIGRQA